MKKLQLNIVSFCVLGIFLLFALATSNEVEIIPLNTEMERTATHLIVKNLDTFDYSHYSLNVWVENSIGKKAFYYWNDINSVAGKKNDFNLLKREKIELPFKNLIRKKLKDESSLIKEENLDWSSPNIKIHVLLNGYDPEGKPCTFSTILK